MAWQTGYRRGERRRDGGDTRRLGNAFLRTTNWRE